MTPKDMNTAVRAHLRKGELAVEHLEKLGWTFEQNVPSGPFVWKAPEEDALVKAVVDLIESRLVKPVDPLDACEPPVVKSGEMFKVFSTPVGTHGVLRETMRMHSRDTFRARVVEDHRHWGWIVRFGVNAENKGFWLPVKCVEAIKHDNF